MMDERDDEPMDDWTLEGMTMTFDEPDDADARRVLDQALRAQEHDARPADVNEPEAVQPELDVIDTEPLEGLAAIPSLPGAAERAMERSVARFASRVR